MEHLNAEVKEETLSIKDEPICIDQVWFLCRGCLRNADSSIEITAIPEGMPSLSEMLSETMKIQVPPDRPFPHLLCRPCAQNLCATYNFREMCLESHRKLMALFDQSDSRLLPPKLPSLADRGSELPNFSGAFVQPIRLPRFTQNRSSQTQPMGDHCSVCKLDPSTYGISTPRSKFSKFSCSMCSDIFSKRLQYKTHMITVHKLAKKEVKYPNKILYPTIFTCETCHMTINNRTEYNEHIGLCHKGHDSALYTEAEDLSVYSYMKAYNFLDVVIKTESTKESSDEDMIYDIDENRPKTENINKIGNVVQNEESNGSDWNISGRNLVNIKTETKSILTPSNGSLKLPKNENHFSCKECGETFISRLCLRRHMLVHGDGIKLHQCPDCGKTFTRIGHVKRHLATHNNVKKFKCEFCHRTFRRKDNMTVHMRQHADPKYECESCNKKFITEDLMLQHRITAHTRRKLPKTVFCPVCNQGFVREKSMKAHMNIHNGEKAMNCEVCNKTFHTKWQLNDHTKIHLAQKDFLCSQCGKGFRRKDFLTIHMRRHTGENPFKCKHCGKGFPRMTDLTSHVKYHTGDKSHVCTICGLGFIRPYSLKVHMRVHTGEKPYACKHCNKKFSQPYDLKLHIRRHTGERINCEVCGKEFIQGYLLRQHKKTVHGIDTASRISRLAKRQVSKHSSEEENSIESQNEC